MKEGVCFFFLGGGGWGGYVLYHNLCRAPPVIWLTVFLGNKRMQSALPTALFVM